MSAARAPEEFEKMRAAALEAAKLISPRNPCASKTLTLTPPVVKPPAAPEPVSFCTLTDIAKFYGSVSWTWPGWIPQGHFSLIAGITGVGKSYFATYLIGVLTGAFAEWPGGAKAEIEPAPVLLLETEEFRGAYAARLAAMGGNPGKVILLKDDPTYTPQFPKDKPMIAQLAHEQNVGAIVLDSLSGGHNLDENSAAMRTIIKSLTALAAELRIPVIGLHHARKKSQFENSEITLDRIRGSSTITQFARSVIGLDRLDPNDLAAPVKVCALKCSFGKPPEPFGFEIGEGGLTFGPAPEPDKPETAIDRAIELLRVELRDGPKRYAYLLDMAENQGVSKNTLYRAKDKLYINVINSQWSLPVVSSASKE